MGSAKHLHLEMTSAADPVSPTTKDALFWESLSYGLDREGSFLQLQIRQMIVKAIEDGRLPLGMRMPSSRDLAAILKVSRNTIVIAYEQLVDQNFLVSRERSGYFVSGLPKHIGASALPAIPDNTGADHWADRYVVKASAYRNIVKPLDWQKYPYAFIFGQFDPTLFPTNDWRESARCAERVGNQQLGARHDRRGRSRADRAVAASGLAASRNSRAAR